MHIDWLRLGLHRTLLRLYDLTELRLECLTLPALLNHHVHRDHRLGRRLWHGRWLWGRRLRLHLGLDNSDLWCWLLCRLRLKHRRKVGLRRDGHLNWRCNWLLGNLLIHCFSFQCRWRTTNRPVSSGATNRSKRGTLTKSPRAKGKLAMTDDAKTLDAIIGVALSAGFRQQEKVIASLGAKAQLFELPPWARWLVLHPTEPPKAITLDGKLIALESPSIRREGSEQ